MKATIVKRQFRQLKRSIYPGFDFLQLLYAYAFRPANKFISSKVKFINKGKFTTDGPFYFGVNCNNLGALKTDRSLLKISKTGSFVCGKNVKISAGCQLHVNGSVSIGDNTYINPHTLIVVNNALVIGRDCAISWNCQIMDNDGHSFSIDGVERPLDAPIVIGNKVWIGSNVILKKGITIGDGVAIASGSIVTKSIPPQVVAAGMPAKVIRNNITWK